MPTPITRTQLKQLNSMRSDMTPEQLQELEEVNRRASAFSSHRELYAHVKEKGYQPGDDPQSLVRSYVELTGFAPDTRGFDVSGPKDSGPGTNAPRIVQPTSFEQLTQGYFGKAMRADEAEEHVLGKLNELFGPQAIEQFAALDSESRKKTAIDSANKKQGVKRAVSKGLHLLFGGAPMPELAREEREQLKNVDETDEAAVAGAVADEVDHQLQNSAGYVFQWAQSFLTPEQEVMADAIASSDDPGSVMSLYGQQLEELSKDPETWQAFQTAVFSLEPELDRNFWERQAGVFGMAERRMREFGRFAKNMGTDLLNIGEKETEQMAKLGYDVRKMTGYEKLKDLGTFQEGVLAVEGITADMLAVGAVSSVPVVGQGAALTYTFGSFQNRMEETLRFEHGVPKGQARLISGVFGVPYALSEYYQVKHLHPANWGKGAADDATKLFIGMKKHPNIYMHYFSQYFKRGVWKELKEEYVQAGLEFAAMESARVFAESEGIEFTDNLQAMVQDAAQATLYMPFVTALGGGIMGGADAAVHRDPSRMIAPEFKQAMHDRFVPAAAWDSAQGARKRFNEMMESGEFQVEDFPKQLKDLVRRADGADRPESIQEWSDLEQTLVQKVKDAKYINDPNEVIESIRQRNEMEDVISGLTEEEVAIYRDQMERQLGEVDETSVLTSPKLSLIESMMDSYGGRLGVTLRPVKTQEEALSDPVIRAKYEANGGKGKIKAVLLPNREMVVVEENISNAADGVEQVAHEMFGHRGLDLNPKAGALFAELKKTLNLDFIRSELPAFYRTQSDDAVLEEYLVRLTAKAAKGQELGSEQASNAWNKFKEWAGRELGLTPDAAMRAQDVARLAKDVLSFSKGYNAQYPDGTEVSFNRTKYRREGGQWVNPKGQAVNDAGLTGELEALADEQLQKETAKERTERKKQAQQQISQMIDADPVLKMVTEENGIRMPDLKPGESYPDEYAAIPERFRGKRGKGLPLDEMADQVAALSGETADYSTDDLRAHLEQFEGRAEQVLQQAESTEQPGADEEARLIAALERGEISEAEFNAALDELVPRFSVERHADDGRALRGNRVPVSDKAVQMLGVRSDKTFFADYEYLLSKHPNEFTSAEEVRQVVEWVLDNPDDVLAGTGEKNRVLDRWEDAEHKNRVVVRVELTGGQYHVRSAHRMGPKYEKRSRQSDSTAYEGGGEARSKGSPLRDQNYTPAGEEGQARFSVAGRQQDLAAMPESMNEAVAGTTLSFLKKHPDYQRAKHESDGEAAYRVVLDLMPKIDLEKIKAAQPDVVIGVDSFEGGGKNAIPYALKHELAEQLGIGVAEIAVIDKLGSNTGSGEFDRMASDYQYEVDSSIKGKRVLIADDAYTSGETVLMVADSVVKAGGTPVMVATLAFSQGGKGIKPKPEQIQRLLDIMGRSAQDFEHEYGFKPSQFTAKELHKLTALKSGVKDLKGYLEKFIGGLAGVQRERSPSRVAGQEAARYSVAEISAGTDLYNETQENNLSDDSGGRAAPADGGGIRRILPGLSGDTNGGKGRQKLGTVRGFHRTEKIVDTGWTRIYTGRWDANSDAAPIFETVVWNGVDAWVRQPMASTQRDAHDVAGHAHNYFSWNTRNEAVLPHEGMFSKNELLPEEPKPNTSDNRRAEERLEQFAQSDIRTAHENDLRFSVEQLGFFDALNAPDESAADREIFPKETRQQRLAKSKPAEIEDFGEVLHGARKHYAAAYADKLESGAKLDTASNPMSKTWPEPSYQKLLDEGGDPEVIGFVHAARDEVPAKPRSGWKLKRYVQTLETLREFSDMLLSGKIDKEKLFKLLEQPQYERLNKEVGARAELYAAVGHEKSLKGLRVRSGHYSMLNGVEYKPAKTIWTVEKSQAKTAYGNWPRMLGMGETRQAAIEDFRKNFSAFKDSSDRPKKVKFDLYTKRGASGVFIGKKIGRNYVDLQNLPDVKAARQYLEENQSALEKQLEDYKRIPSERRAENAPRVGEDFRQGTDVTPEWFTDQFGFRGVQFGNYVEGPRRQTDLNNTYDALMDLATLLDIPPRAVSLNGSLGLAFGARGTGGKNAPSAHFEPDTIVINLTKNNGPGSLGHEWWHALDNYFSRMQENERGFMTAEGHLQSPGVRPEMVQAFSEVITAIRATQLPARSRRLDARRSKPYWSEMVEMSARSFESYLISRSKQMSVENDYLVNFKEMVDYIVESFADEEMYPYPTDAEYGAIHGAFKRLFDAIQHRETEKGTALFSIDQQQDIYQETAVHIAGRIFSGNFQFKQITKGKKKGQIIQRPEKEQLDEVAKLLKDQGASGKPAAEVLAAANEIALNVSKDRENLTNNRQVSRAIRDEGVRQQFRTMARRAHQKGMEGGAYFEAGKVHVEERIRQAAEAAMRTRPGLMIEDLEETYGIRVRDLLDQLELEEKREKLKTDDGRPKPEEIEEETAGEDVPPDLTPEEQEIYREPADVYLFKVKSAVIRSLLKEGAIDDAGSLTKNLKNPIVRAEYIETVKHVLLKTSNELMYGFQRDVIEREIRRMDELKLLSSVDKKAERLIQRMFDERVRETKEELYQRAKTELDGFKGRIKSRMQDVNRKVTGRIEKMLNAAGKALRMPAEAAEKKLMMLNDRVQSLAGKAFEGDPDAQAEFEDAIDELNAYMRFAAFRYKTTAEMAEQLDWLENTMADEMQKQEERREALRKETKGFLNKILPTLPNRLEGRPGRAYFSQFLEQKLERIAHFGKEGQRQEAQKILKELSFDLARANFRKHQGVAADNRAFGEALAEIYGVRGPQTLRPTRIQQKLHDLSRLRDEYAQYSLDGVRLSKAHLLQIVGSLAQDDIRAAARVQTELLPLVEGKEGTVEEIAKSLWQDEDSAIKYTTSDGHALTAGVLEHFVKTIQDGARMAKRLRMEKAMLKELTAEDMKLLNWFRDYYRRNRPALSEVNKEVTGLQIVAPDVYYIPIKRDIERGLKGVNVAMPVVPPSLTIRTFNARDLDETASIVDLYMQRLESNQTYIHFAKQHQRIARLFNNAELLKALRNTHGKKFVDELLEHQRDVISSQPISGSGSDAAKHVTNFFAATRLGFNVSLMPRQVTSLPAFAMYVPTKEFLKYSSSAFTKDGLDTMKIILASPHAKTRLRLGNTQMLNQMLAEMDSKGNTLGLAEIYQRLGTLPTKLGDIVPTLIFGSGYYRAMLDDAARQGMRGEEAQLWAMDQLWRLVEMSQQSGLMVNLARWQRSGGPAFKLLGQFISTPQQFVSKEFHDIMDLAAAIETEGWNSERTRKAALQAGKSVGTGGILLSFLYGGMKMLWNALLGDEPDEDDWQRFLADVLSGPFSGIVIFGTVIEAAISGALMGERGYGNTLVPAAGLVSDAQTFGSLLYHLLNDPEKALSDLDALLRSNQALYRDFSKVWKNVTD